MMMTMMVKRDNYKKRDGVGDGDRDRGKEGDGDGDNSDEIIF